MQDATRQIRELWIIFFHIPFYCFLLISTENTSNTYNIKNYPLFTVHTMCFFVIVVTLYMMEVDASTVVFRYKYRLHVVKYTLRCMQNWRSNHNTRSYPRNICKFINTIYVKFECESRTKVLFFWLCLYECACFLASMTIRNGTIVIWLELSLWALIPLRNCAPQSANKAKIHLKRLHLNWMQFFSCNIIA